MKTLWFLDRNRTLPQTHEVLTQNPIPLLTSRQMALGTTLTSPLHDLLSPFHIPFNFLSYLHPEEPRAQMRIFPETPPLSTHTFHLSEEERPWREALGGAFATNHSIRVRKRVRSSQSNFRKPLYHRRWFLGKNLTSLTSSKREKPVQQISGIASRQRYTWVWHNAASAIHQEELVGMRKSLTMFAVLPVKLLSSRS